MEGEDEVPSPGFHQPPSMSVICKLNILRLQHQISQQKSEEPNVKKAQRGAMAGAKDHLAQRRSLVPPFS